MIAIYALGEALWLNKQSSETQSPNAVAEGDLFL